MQKVKNAPIIADNANNFSEENQEWIDIANTKEIFLTLSLFFLFLFSIIYFAVEGNQEFTVYYSEQYLFKNKKPFRNYLIYDFQLLPFNSRNRFLKFYLYFNRNTSKSVNSNISFIYLVKLLYPNITEYNSIHNNTVDFHFEKDQEWTDEYPLYIDYMLEFKSISLQLKILKENNTIFSGFDFVSLYCSSESTTFSIYFVFVFTCFHFILFKALLYKKYSKQIKSYRLEQILLFPLLFFMILSNNPLYFLHLYHPTRLYYNLMIFSVPICDAFIYFATVILMFYSGLADKKISMNSDSKNRFVKILIVAFIFSIIYLFIMIHFNYYLTNHSMLVPFPTLEEHRNNQNVYKYKSIAVSISTIIMLFLLFSSFIVTDNVTLNAIIYLIIFLPVFIQEFCFNGIFIYFELVNERIEGTLMMSKMVIQNIYCLFLVYVHWPCDIREKYLHIDSNLNKNNDNETFVDVIDV